MADDCINCPGGSNLVFRLNPDPDVVDISRVDNVVLIPQRLNPSRVFLDDLGGIAEIDPELLLTGKPYVLRWADDRVYEDDGVTLISGSCGFEVTEPDDCQEVVWDPSASLEPEIVDGLMPMALAISAATDCATHIFCNGRWVCLEGAGGGGGTPGNPNLLVCYPDLSGQTFSAGSGEWIVFGTDVMTTFTCGDERVTTCVNGIETSTDYGSISGTGPGAGWGSLNWSDDLTPTTGSVLDGCDSIIQSTQDGDPRREYRLDFEIPSGSGCPLVLRFNYAGGGSIGIAAWDAVSNSTLTVFVTDGPGNAAVQAGPTGPVVRETTGAAGDYVLLFQCPAGVDPANVRFVLFNWGNSTPETATDLTLTYTQSSAAGCFEWPTINSLADWLNANDPNGVGWAVVGDEVCKTVGPGQATAYGTLAGTNTGASPTVSEV